MEEGEEGKKKRVKPKKKRIKGEERRRRGFILKNEITRKNIKVIPSSLVTA